MSQHIIDMANELALSEILFFYINLSVVEPCASISKGTFKV
jgi:hypothetical protein